LGEILLDRSNFNVMTKYISSAENLKLMMNLLRDKSRNIQFEAFHVFKESEHFRLLTFMTLMFLCICLFQQVFVANPNKNKPILDILTKNQERLIVFLSNFHNDRHGKKKRIWSMKAIFPLRIIVLMTWNLIDDEQFNDEKAFLLKQIQDLKPAHD
jgi:calcium binding protein 39